MLREQLTIRLVKEVCGGLNVGDEMAFLDAPERLADIHLPCEMCCMGFVYCMQGSIRYTVDTISHTMQRGNVLLIPIGPTLNGVTADADLAAALSALGEELRFALLVSKAVVKEGDALSVDVHVSGGQKCERCWHYTEDVGTVAEHATVCARCADNIDGQGETRNYV